VGCFKGSDPFSVCFSVYDEATARRIYESIKRKFVALERVFEKLRALTP